MSDLNELYQEVLLDHAKSPRCYGKLENFNRDIESFNPLCGDKVHLYLQVEDNKILGCSFEGQGCAISMASASMMLEALKSCSCSDASRLFEEFHGLLTHKHIPSSDNLGKLIILENVKNYPSRIKCALLPWHALENALRMKS